MVNEFVEKHRGMLRFYSLFARVLGWALLLIGGSVVGRGVYYRWPFSGESSGFFMIYLLQRLLLGFLFPVLFMFLISQLINFVIDPEYRYGWFLRCGYKLLYAYAVAVVLSAIFNSYFQFADVENSRAFVLVTRVVPSVGSHLAYVLVLIGIAYIVKKLLVIVEEARTLV